MIAFEYIYNRRVPLIYTTPAICEFDFSGSGEPSIYLAPITRTGAPTGLVFGGIGGYMLSWGIVPGALCYSVYRSVDEDNPYGEYQLVAECIDTAYYQAPDGDDHWYRVEVITEDGVSDLSDPLKAPGSSPHPSPPPPPPVGCSQYGDPLPATWKEAASEPILGSHQFTTLANTSLTAVVPAGKGGYYQFRYTGGAQGMGCDFSPPDYSWYGMGMGLWVVTVGGSDVTEDWFTPDWIAHMDDHHSGWSASGFWMIRRTSSGPWVFWESTLDGPLTDANVEAEFIDAGKPPGYTQFCFEGQLAAGQTASLGFYQEFYTSCSGRPHITVKSGGPTFELVRVAKLKDQPATATVLNYPVIGNLVFTPYSYSETICDYSSTNALGFCILRGNVVTRKWTLMLPFPAGGWEGEKNYGSSPVGNYQRTSATGPDCLVVV